jgi:hypothetical protein
MQQPRGYNYHPAERGYEYQDPFGHLHHAAAATSAAAADSRDLSLGALGMLNLAQHESAYPYPGEEDDYSTYIGAYSRRARKERIQRSAPPAPSLSRNRLC